MGGKSFSFSQTMKLKQLLSAKVLLIFVLAGLIGFIDTKTDLKLGLDLQGGTQLDYKIDLSEVPSADQEQIVEGVQEVIRRRVDALGVSEPQIYSSSVADEHHVIVELAGISDIEEAKAIVGKTIQLEFYEENTEPSEDQLSLANESASAYYNELRSGADFVELSEKYEESYDGTLFWVDQPLQDISKYSDEMQAAIEGYGKGAILSPFEINDGISADSAGNLFQLEGVSVVQIVDKQITTEEVEIPEEVTAKHILVAYKGSERSTVTRSQTEAQARIAEVQAKLAEGADLGELAATYSDDPGSALTGGELGSFGRGAMTQTFEDAVFSMEVGQVSGVVESPFGYHIIELTDKTGGGTETQSITQVQVNKAIFMTTPDPWADTAALTGEHFKRADAMVDQQSFQYYVQITFTDEGAKLFEELTAANVGSPIAIFVGGNLISAPNVNETIAGGTAQITGNFSAEEAQELARDLNTGAIPAPVELAGQYTISATLGSEALDLSIKAGVIGLIILAFYMIAYYRLPGLLATLALAIYSVLVLFFVQSSLHTAIAILIGLAAFSYLVHVILKNRESGGEKFVSFVLACIVLFFLTFVLSNPVTLTLAGIAGVILSIGMAVDANVLIFERVKEELAEGKDVKIAIEEGFARAWDSIRDSNFSSLITCAILAGFGSSIIRGFAINLALGILVSMLSAITLTKTFLQFTAETPVAKHLWLFNKPKKKAKEWFQIIKNSKIWAGISGTLVTAAILVTALFGLNLGLDFTGGTMLEVTVEQEETLSTDTITDLLFSVEEEMEGDFGSPQVVHTDQDSYLIRLKHITEDEHDAIMSKFNEIAPTEEVRFTTVGPTIGQTLKRKAVTALAVTLLMIVIYIAFAFRKIPKEVSPWRFGLCAIAALAHDVLIVLGVFVVLGRFMGVEIDALFITALLTIMGFSVHDTIVVFDRVRENLRFQKHNESLADTTNKALNQTMARSLNTSISTLITIVALLIWGAPSIQMFVLALAIGILVGTYSSIFVASPLLVWWNNRARKN